jgi:hypothetical protein
MGAMRARKLILAIAGLLLVSLAGGLGVLFYLLKVEPDFYQHCVVPESKERKTRSAEFLGLFGQLAGHIADSKGKWQVCFTQAHINSYFAEDFIRLGDAAHLQRQGISEPRVVFDKDRLRLAFRYGSNLWSTVFSFDLRTWLAPEEPNVIALEFLSRNAGALPISAKSFLDQISAIARRNKIEVVWFRHKGNPVALLHLTTGRDRASAQLTHLRIEGGKLTIGGISFEPGQPITQDAAVEATADQSNTQ